MSGPVDLNQMRAGDLYRQARAAQSALNLGVVKVPFQAEIKAINLQFLDLLEANPNATVGEVKRKLTEQIENANFHIGILNKIDVAGMISVAVGIALMVFSKDASLASIFAMVGAGSLLGTTAPIKRKEAEASSAETSIRRVDEWVEALHQPALQGVPLDRLVASTLEDAIMAPKQ